MVKMDILLIKRLLNKLTLGEYKMMKNRIANFIVFLLLTLLTLGLYPVYFWITLTKERNELLEKILVQVSK